MCLRLLITALTHHIKLNTRRKIPYLHVLFSIFSHNMFLIITEPLLEPNAKIEESIMYLLVNLLCVKWIILILKAQCGIHKG